MRIQLPLERELIYVKVRYYMLEECQKIDKFGFIVVLPADWMKL